MHGYKFYFSCGNFKIYLLDTFKYAAQSYYNNYIWSSVESLSRVQFFGTPWTVAHQPLWSMGFSRQEYWNGLPFPSPGDIPDPGIEPKSPALQADALPSEPPRKPLLS